MQKTKSEPRIQVIDRAAMLLDTLSRYSTPVKLKVLSADTDLAPSTAYRILNSLVDNGFIDRNESSEYQLSLQLLKMSRRLNTHVNLREVALPYMEALRDKTGEAINLTSREGDVIIYIERATPNRMMHVQQMIGSRAPLHVTGVGKLMLGASGENGIRSYEQRTNLPAYTQNTFSSYDALKDECLKSISRGYAFDNEEAEMGVGCIGVLLYGQNGMSVAGLSLSAPIERRKDEWVEDIIAAGKEISIELGFKDVELKN